MTAKLMNKKFMALLKRNHIKPPYMIVAHFYGGMYAGYFARKYPYLVKGMLMIDPIPGDYKRSTDFSNHCKPDIEKMLKLSTYQAYKQYSYDVSNKNNLRSAQLFFQLIGFMKTKEEISELLEISNNIPVIILSSTYVRKNAPIKGNWFVQQHQWMNKNIGSKIIQVKSGHFIQLQRPTLVCDQLK